MPFYPKPALFLAAFAPVHWVSIGKRAQHVVGRFPRCFLGCFLFPASRQ
jgi:hypothetical protein